MDKGKLWKEAVENCIMSGYTSPNTKKNEQIKGNWIGTHIRKESCKQYTLENPKERCHLGDQATCMSIIFRLIIWETRGWWCRLDQFGSRKQDVAGSYNCGNEPWDSFKSNVGNFFTTNMLLKKDSALKSCPFRLKQYGMLHTLISNPQNLKSALLFEMNKL